MEINTRVKWTSSANGVTKEKVGRIVEIVPAGARPVISVDSTATPRDHVSYVVKVDMGSTRKPKFYLPRVSALTVL